MGVVAWVWITTTSGAFDPENPSIQNVQTKLFKKIKKNEWAGNIQSHNQNNEISLLCKQIVNEEWTIVVLT